MAKTNYILGEKKRPVTLKDAIQQEQSDEDSMRTKGSSHYVSMGIQPFDIVAANYSIDHMRGLLIGKVLKYLMRYHLKDGLKDLGKAEDCLKRLIKLEQDESNRLRDISHKGLQPKENEYDGVHP